MRYMYLDDISSLTTIACCVPELRTIDFRPFTIENVLGGPPSTEIDRIRWLIPSIPNKLL